MFAAAEKIATAMRETPIAAAICSSQP